MGTETLNAHLQPHNFGKSSVSNFFSFLSSCRHDFFLKWKLEYFSCVTSFGEASVLLTIILTGVAISNLLKHFPTLST